VFCDVTLKVSKQRALTLEVTGFCRGVIEASRSSGLLRRCKLGTANLRHLNISEERNPELRKSYCFYILLNVLIAKPLWLLLSLLSQFRIMFSSSFIKTLSEEKTILRVHKSNS
jgi:hypothetical protein